MLFCHHFVDLKVGKWEFFKKPMKSLFRKAAEKGCQIHWDCNEPPHIMPCCVRCTHMLMVIQSSSEPELGWIQFIREFVFCMGKWSGTYNPLPLGAGHLFRATTPWRVIRGRFSTCSNPKAFCLAPAVSLVNLLFVWLTMACSEGWYLLPFTTALLILCL